jgi:hypothetical protein
MGEDTSVVGSWCVRLLHGRLKMRCVYLKVVNAFSKRTFCYALFMALQLRIFFF